MSDIPGLLVVARHAESVRNAAKAGHVFFRDAESRRGLETQGDHEAGLTDAGTEQARALGERMHREFGAFDLVYHSGYHRARQTAEMAVAAMHDQSAPMPPIREHMFLRERDAGYAFNMTEAEVDEAFPWLQSHWKTVGPFFGRPPGGESLADVAIRVQSFFETCAEDLAGRQVLLVTHAGTIRMIRYLLEHWTQDDAHARWSAEPISNAGAIAYDARGGRLRLRSSATG